MDEIIADIPFDTDKHEVIISQGFNAPFSHKIIGDIDMRYGLDFALPIGTEIRAVRDGIAIVYKGGGACYRGLDPVKGRGISPATFIKLKHEDLKDGKRTITSMIMHVDPKNILIKSRDRVKRGQVIAKTGLDGWIGPIPHLHLQFYNRHATHSLPFKLNGYNESLEDKDTIEMLKKINNDLCQEILRIRRDLGLL